MASKLMVIVAGLNRVRKILLAHEADIMGQLKLKVGDSEYGTARQMFIDFMRKLEFGEALLTESRNHSQETVDFLKTLDTKKKRDDYKLAVTTRIMTVIKTIVWPCADLLYANKFPKHNPLVGDLEGILSGEEEGEFFTAMQAVLKAVEEYARKEGWPAPDGEAYVEKLSKDYSIY
jgi:hypothetical protein